MTRQKPSGRQRPEAEWTVFIKQQWRGSLRGQTFSCDYERNDCTELCLRVSSSNNLNNKLSQPFTCAWDDQPLLTVFNSSSPTHSIDPTAEHMWKTAEKSNKLICLNVANLCQLIVKEQLMVSRGGLPSLMIYFCNYPLMFKPTCTCTL